MSNQAEKAGSSATLLGAAAAVALLLIGAGVYLGTRQLDDPATDPVAAVVPQPAPGTAPAAEPDEAVATAKQDTPEAPADPVAPTIDEVRMEPDGLTVIAGRALPGSTVDVLLDGAESTSVVADTSGAFAAVTMITPSDQPMILSLLQRGDGSDVASDDEVILTPAARAAEPDTEIAALAPQDTDITTKTPAPSGDTAVDAAPDTPALETASEVESAATDTASSAPDDMAETATTESEAVTAEPQTTETAGVDADTAADALVGTETAETTVTTAPTDTADAENAAAQAPKPESTATEGPTVATVAPSVDVADTETASTEVAPGTSEAQTPPAQTEEVAALDATDTAAPAATEAEAEQPARVAILKNTEEGVELLGAGPEVMDNVALDTISYSDTGGVQLAGRAQEDATAVRVYLDNAPIAVLPVDPDGRWRGDLPQVDTGVYELRVDEVNTTGAVTSRVVTPFKREDPDVLAAATDPTARASSVTVQTGDTLWAISRDRYGEGLLYVRVFEANRKFIRDPDLIYPGQVFALPD